MLNKKIVKVKTVSQSDSEVHQGVLLIFSQLILPSNICHVTFWVLTCGFVHQTDLMKIQLRSCPLALDQYPKQFGFLDIYLPKKPLKKYFNIDKYNPGEQYKRQ